MKRGSRLLWLDRLGDDGLLQGRSNSAVPVVSIAVISSAFPTSLNIHKESVIQHILRTDDTAFVIQPYLLEYSNYRDQI